MLAVPTKSALRKILLQRRAELSAEARTHADRCIATALRERLLDAPPQAIALYLPMRHEPVLTDLRASLLAHGHRILLPVVAEKDSPLIFVDWNADCELARDAAGVQVPANWETLEPQVPEVVVMPCLGFNRRRFRLGYGGGYYDRTLADLHEARPMAIGVAHACCEVEFEVEAYDQPLRLVVTETGIVE